MLFAGVSKRLLMDVRSIAGGESAVTVDYLVVGSGLTGAVIARLLADRGREVFVVERRNHVGGNVYDHCHKSGIRIHTYGPHYFRTSSLRIWEFALQFGAFYPYEATIKSLVDGKYENWPIAASYIRRTVGSDWTSEFTGCPTNFEEASLAMMPAVVYQKFVQGYTEKQWGVPARTLATSLAKRFEVREDDDPRLMRHPYQGIPACGYADWTRSMLAGIPVLLNCDYLRARDSFKPRKHVIFTGPIDEFFEFDLGRLKYRGQIREDQYLPGVELALPCGQVNNSGPDTGPHIRTLEWKHMMPAEYASRITGTVLTKEVTTSIDDPNHYEYPFPDAANTELYKQYRSRAEAIPKLLICGRLGEYRYFDMDQVIGHAMVLAERLLAA
jgi:UDP-galactopyranose mutase